MELKHYFSFARRWFWLIAILGLAGGFFGSYNSSRQTTLYAAKSTLLVNQSNGLSADPSPNLDALRARERFALTVMEVVRARPVVSQALTNLGIQKQLSVALVQSRINTELVGGTELFTLEVQAESKDEAVAINEQLIAAFGQLERDLLANPYSQGSSLIVIEAPRPLPSAVFPETGRDLALYAAVGILLAILLGLLRDYYNDGMSGGGDMERLTGLAPLATVGVLKGSTRQAKLVTVNDAYSPNAETYRMFRTHLDTYPLDHPVQTIAVTSASPRDGRSITAANLAVALAQTGRRVVLVDSDLRQPSLHEFFGMTNPIGLTHLLTHEIEDVRSYLRPTGVDNLRLLAGGLLALQPAQLIGSVGFERLVTQLRQETDLIVFDTPSLLAVVDGTLLTRVADVTLIVARAGSTRATALRRAFEHLKQSNVNILGVLLNAAPTENNRDRSYYSDLHRRQKGHKHAAGATSPLGEATESRAQLKAIEAGSASLAGKNGD